MLEKMTKLRAILLMEGDFNATNKIVYGVWMMKNAWGYHLMPKEIFSKKNHMANNGKLCKTLFYNITQQAWVPAAIASVNASNCYNRIAHALALLIFQAFGVPLTAVETMLGAIENMKLFLRTGFGNSNLFLRGGISMKTQGLTQGNGASPAGWAVISIHTSWERMERRDMGKSSTVPSQTCSVIFWQSSMWTTPTYCTSTWPRTKAWTRSTTPSKTASTAGGTSS